MTRDSLIAIVGLIGFSAFVAASRGLDAASSQTTFAAVAPAERQPTTFDSKGVFETVDAAEVACRPEAYAGELEIVEVAEPGEVARGQVLVRFRSDGLIDQIRQAEVDLAIARAKLARQAEETARKEESMALKVRRSELDLSIAQQAADTKKSIEIPQQLENLGDGVKNWDVERQESEKEFDILVNMYQDDGQIEGAEKLDIDGHKRRLDVDLKRKPFEFAQFDLLKNIRAPREIAKVEFALRKAKYADELLRATAPMQVAQAKNELEKSQLSLRKQEESLTKLRRDVDALTLRAPAAGYAFAGQLKGGKWSALDDTARLLRPKTRVPAQRVLFTIVRPAPKLVRTTIPEAKLLDVVEGQDATLIPTALPNVRLEATVSRVSRVPVEGQLEVWLTAKTRHERLFPGNTCKVRFTLAEKATTSIAPDGKREGDVAQPGSSASAR